MWAENQKMLKIRLQRTGRKNDPSYRVVVTEHTRGPKSEKHVDRVGFYNPKTKEQKLDEGRIKHWIENGAQASGTVHNMLVKAGILKGETINVLPKKTPIISEQPEEEKKEENPVEAADATEEATAQDESNEESAEETPSSEDAQTEDQSDSTTQETEEEKKEV